MCVEGMAVRSVPFPKTFYERFHQPLGFAEEKLRHASMERSRPCRKSSPMRRRIAYAYVSVLTSYRPTFLSVSRFRKTIAGRMMGHFCDGLLKQQQHRNGYAL